MESSPRSSLAEQVGGPAGSTIWFGLWIGLLLFPSPRQLLGQGDFGWSFAYAIGGAIGLRVADDVGRAIGSRLARGK